MKITYLHQYFNTRSMTGGTRSYEMARRLVAAGHEVHMITSARGGEKTNSDWFTTIEEGITVHWKPVPYSNHMSNAQRMRAFFRFAGASARKAATLESDIVFATSTPLTIAIPAAYASWRLKVPMVFEVRDLWPELPIAVGALRNPLLQALARRLERWAYSKSSAVVALSPGMREGIMESGYPASQIVVIPNSSDNGDFDTPYEVGRRFREARTWLQDRPLLTYAGTLGQINGVGYLVDLAAAIHRIDPSVCFLVVGDGQERQVVEDRARSLGLLDVNFFMESQISKADMPELLSATTMAVSLFIDLPEMQANSANKFFDALSAGRPILLNYGGWQADLLAQSGAGFSVWKIPIEVAALRVVEHIRQPGWLSTAGRDARRLACERFDRDVLASQLEETLWRVANSEASSVSDITTPLYP